MHQDLQPTTEKSRDLICWLDLETTGSDPVGDRILEIAMVLTDNDFNIVREFSEVVRPPEWRYYLHRMDPVVHNMHLENGLLREVDAMAVTDMFALEQRLMDFLPRDKEHIALAGSGVCHFDRAFIKRDFEHLNKRFTYWTYDIGVIRRVFRLAGLPTPDVENTKKHRAIDDVRGDIDQMNDYMAMLARLEEIMP